jgi:predicted transcriptional regulator
MRVITVREQLAARNARIVAVCQAGATLAEIAADYGITATRVGQILAEAGLTRHLRRVRRREQLLAVVRDLAPGRTVGKVAELMGLSKWVVYSLAREGGVACGFAASSGQAV